MALTVYRAQVRLNTLTALPEDVVTNTFHFEAEDNSPADQQAILNAVEDFYTATLSTGRTLASHYPQQMDDGPHEIRLYDLSQPKPRVPVDSLSFTFASVPAGTGLPTECAAVLSFEGDKVSGIPQARRRNRIYFGPLDTADAVSSATRVNIGANLIADLLAAAEAMNTALLTGETWVAYSETYNIWTPVTTAWVDNAFDTQRRRGTDATSRTSVVI